MSLSLSASESRYSSRYPMNLPGSSITGTTLSAPFTPTPSTRTDPQTWVYPPPGAGSAPTAVTANFGPVHLHDHMLLQWWPHTLGVEAGLYCVDGTLNSQNWQIGSGEDQMGQPYIFEFANNGAQGNATGEQLCHVHFYNSFNGNSVVWRYVAQERADSDVVTWGAPYVPTSPPHSDGGHGGIHLTIAEKAAIGLGAAVFVCLLSLALILLCWYKRRKRRLRPWQQSQPWPQAPRVDSPPPYEPPTAGGDQELQEVREVEAVPEAPGNLVLAPELSSSRSGARRANASELASWNSQRFDRSWRIINAL